MKRPSNEALAAASRIVAGLLAGGERNIDDYGVAIWPIAEAIEAEAARRYPSETVDLDPPEHGDIE